MTLGYMQCFVTELQILLNRSLTGVRMNEILSMFNVESWLLHHGQKIQERFQVASYKLMNQLLKTIDASDGSETPYEVLNTD